MGNLAVISYLFYFEILDSLSDFAAHAFCVASEIGEAQVVIQFMWTSARQLHFWSLEVVWLDGVLGRLLTCCSLTFAIIERGQPFVAPLP